MSIPDNPCTLFREKEQEIEREERQKGRFFITEGGMSEREKKEREREKRGRVEREREIDS